MVLRRSLLQLIVLVTLSIFSSLLASCSSSNSGGSTESLRIYEMVAAKGTFTVADGDSTGSEFQLTLSGVPNEILSFTNRGAQEGGYGSVDNAMNNIWPRVYGGEAPNAIMKGTTANQESIELFCILDKPVYNKETGQLGFSVTYLDGQRPTANLGMTDVKIIISNNAPQAQPEVWSHLLAGETGTFEPTSVEGSYTFRLQKTSSNAFGFTCAPQRKSSSSSVQEYIQGWQDRFGNNPPNATIAYDTTNDQNGGVQVVTLSNPVYDELSGDISFTAKLLYSAVQPIAKNGLKVSNPSLFIDGGAGGFPTAADNGFSIQYRNSTPAAITVWLGGDQPPCSKTEADNCDTGKVNSEYTANWEKLNTSGAFKRSGTHFYIVRTSGKSEEVTVSNHTDLAKGETLRIVPPLSGNIPEWYYKRSGKIETAGVVGWVTKKGISMPAPEPVTVYEYNLDSPNKNIVFDLSAVNGVNTNATMTYEGPGCGNDAKCKTGVTLPKVLKANLEAYNGVNDGCPYILQFASANSCPNPKFYPASFDGRKKPGWVVAPADYSTDKVKSEHETVWKTAGSPSGAQMASAGSGLSSVKPAYHIWWSTNPVGQGWLTYLQKNAKGKTDAYGWAYDEKRWKTSDTFDSFGNPPDNKDVKALVTGPSLKDTYLNIDILKVM